VWIRKFAAIHKILTCSFGVATVLNFKDGGLCGKVTPSGSSHWLPHETFKAILNLMPARDGLINLRAYGMQSAVRPVSRRHLHLLCPSCWDTGKSIHRIQAGIVRPFRVIGLPNGRDEYTAISNLWSEFKRDETVRYMQQSAAMISALTSLWIDNLCVDQKNATSLLFPAHKINAVLTIKSSRHLLAMPNSLKSHNGLSVWKHDGSHGRVWAFQEGHLSSNLS
jgi:hypothetical protein